MKLFKNNKLIIVNKNGKEYLISNGIDSPAPAPDESIPNEMPYISVYNFEPTINIEEDLKIDYYVSDYNEKEYLFEDFSEKYLVEYSINTAPDINGNITTLYSNTIDNVIAGDNSFTINNSNLGSVGEKFLIVQATEKSTGKKTHEFIKEFRIINKTQELLDVSNNTYHMTEQDLIDYNISNQGSIENILNTRVGLQNLFNTKASQGVRKLVMFPGIYLMPKSLKTEALSIPNKFTLDLNGATLKQHVFVGGETTGDINMIVKIDSKFDSHITNGTIIGDLIERNPTTSEDGEFAFAIFVYGGKYCSLTNLEIKDNAGYTVLWGVSGGIGTGKPIGWKNYDVNMTNGTEFISDKRCTCDFLAIPANLYKKRMAVVGEYLGFQSIIKDYQSCCVHFYDSNKDYISSSVSFQYRRFMIPENSSFIRITLFNKIEEIGTATDVVKVINFGSTENLLIKDINFKNTRTCALAPQASYGVIVDNVTFDNCGYDYPTPAAIDFEDGWDMTQDVLIRNCEVIASAGTTDLIVCGGNNYQFDNIKNFRLTLYASNWYRPKGYRIINSEIKGSSIYRYNYQKRGSWNRISNNVFDGSIRLEECATNNFGVIKDSEFVNGSGVAGTNSGLSTALRCTFTDIEGKDFSNLNSTTASSQSIAFKECKFGNMYWQINSNIEFKKCESIAPIKFRLGTNSNTRIFAGCNFNHTVNFVSNSACAGYFNGCTFKDFRLNVSGDGDVTNPLIFENCTLNWNVLNTLQMLVSTGFNFYVKFINCTINDSSNKSILRHSKAGTCDVNIEFDNCIINKTQGILIEDGYASSYHAGATMKLTLKNTPITIPLGNNNVIGTGSIWTIIQE